MDDPQTPPSDPPPPAPEPEVGPPPATTTTTPFESPDVDRIIESDFSDE